MKQLLSSEYVELSKEQDSAEQDLMGLPNVVGVGLGHKYVGGGDTGTDAIIVLVNQKLPTSMLRPSDTVAPQIGKYPTDVIDVGDIFAQPLDAAGDPTLGSAGTSLRKPATIPAAFSTEPQVLKRRIRPAMGGFSVAHTAVTAGTIATGCYDESAFPGIPSKYYILSNNHVLANSNAAAIGDPILQPGPYDGGTLPADLIGRLARFVPIQFHSAAGIPLNLVDAAIAEVPFEDLNREIYWVGYVNRRLPPAVVKPEDVLEKTGRTTNFTTGTVRAVNATVDVNYGGGRLARFAKQIITSAMSAGGDSGSLVLDREERAVGLLFAGSSEITVINPIEFVQSLLKIRLTELP